MRDAVLYTWPPRLDEAVRLSRLFGRCKPHFGCGMAGEVEQQEVAAARPADLHIEGRIRLDIDQNVVLLAGARLMSIQPIWAPAAIEDAIEESSAVVCPRGAVRCWVYRLGQKAPAL